MLVVGHGQLARELSADFLSGSLHVLKITNWRETWQRGFTTYLDDSLCAVDLARRGAADLNQMLSDLQDNPQ